MVVLAAACASGSKQLDLPPVTVTGEAPAQAPASAGTGSADAVTPMPEPASSPSDAAPSSQAQATASPSGSPSSSDESKKDDTLVVIGGSLDESGAPTNREMLRAASRSEHQRRQEGGKPPVLVITDENLSELAENGRLTVASGGAEPTAEEKALMKNLSADETYWRERVLAIRKRWKEAYDSIAELEAKAEELRTRFYSADDPIRRDREIKPQWDRTLDKIEEARTEVDAAKEELEQALDEGTRAGALPGWLREGIELEPKPPEEEPPGELSSTEPVDPVTTDSADVQ